MLNPVLIVLNYLSIVVVLVLQTVIVILIVIVIVIVMLLRWRTLVVVLKTNKLFNADVMVVAVFRPNDPQTCH